MNGSPHDTVSPCSAPSRLSWPFDLVVTVSIGSTLATILLNSQVALAEGVTAFAVLVFALFAITWLSVRSDAFQRLVKSEPALLVRHGEMLSEAMRRERVSKEEIEAAARVNGFGSLGPVEAVILETDGSISVLARRDDGSATGA